MISQPFSEGVMLYIAKISFPYFSNSFLIYLIDIFPNNMQMIIYTSPTQLEALRIIEVF